MAISGFYSFSRGWRATYDVEQKRPMLYMDRMVLSLQNGIIGMVPPFMCYNAWQLGRRVELWTRNLTVDSHTCKAGEIYVEFNNGVCTDVL